MIRVFYTSKQNAFLGGEMFHDGVKDFLNDEEGISFARRYYLKFEVVELDAAPVKKTVRKKVKVVE